MGAGPVVFIFLVSIDIVAFCRGEVCIERILTESRFDEATQRDPSQSGSQCESDFRRHCEESKSNGIEEASYLLQFCNVSLRQIWPAL
jgi:hypothetical protein